MKKILTLILIILANITTVQAYEQKKLFVIVSGVSSGARIAPALKGYGYDIIHIEPTIQKNMQYYTLNQQDYIENLTEEDIDKLAAKSKDIIAVIPGAEVGVDLAEKLNKQFKLPYSNDPTLSHTRRNKHEMQEALHKSGVQSIRQCLAKQISEVTKWVKEQKIQFPIVLKPIQSASSDNVFICKNEKEIQQAFQKIKASLDVFQNTNESVLCQEYIGGQEYMVNTVSWKGEHRIIELLKINKKEINGKPVYDTSKLINSTDEDFKLINLYLSDVYKALGLKYGAAHAEVKVWSKNNKKYVTLIEVGARLGGAASPSALQEAQGYSQLSVLAKSYANPGFLQSIKQQDIVSQKNLTTVFLISNKDGMIKKDFPIDQIRSLKSYHSLHINVKKGDILKKTIDLVTCPGFIYLVGNKEDINRDIQVIRAWENNLYTELL